MPDAIITPAGMRIIKLLIGAPPQTVVNLIKAIGVTRTAIMEQLNELVSSGYVEREAERLTGRGRPRHLYKATNAALLLVANTSQQLVVPAIWNAMRDVGGEELTQKVLKRVSRQVVDHYNRKINSHKPEERLRQFIEIMNSEGGVIDVVRGDHGQMLVHRRSCPFVSIVDENSSVCSIDQELITSIVGRPVRRVACRHNGDPCCRFELDL